MKQAKRLVRPDKAALTLNFCCFSPIHANRTLATAHSTVWNFNRIGLSLRHQPGSAPLPGSEWQTPVGCGPCTIGERARLAARAGQCWGGRLARGPPVARGPGRAAIRDPPVLPVQSSAMPEIPFLPQNTRFQPKRVPGFTQLPKHDSSTVVGTIASARRTSGDTAAVHFLLV